ncbi:60S ribosomal protein L19 [Cichlidogyrus casuarinus]|uniref:60S ribosomal protein L19 n=1 Tax=Cichlidogyrus casuarinus TaxID=1844966 RepID=A0ABD2QMH8_9PLAT
MRAITGYFLLSLLLVQLFISHSESAVAPAKAAALPAKAAAPSAKAAAPPAIPAAAPPAKPAAAPPAKPAAAPPAAPSAKAATRPPVHNEKPVAGCPQQEGAIDKTSGLNHAKGVHKVITVQATKTEETPKKTG